MIPSLINFGKFIVHQNKNIIKTYNVSGPKIYEVNYEFPSNIINSFEVTNPEQNNFGFLEPGCVFQFINDENTLFYSYPEEVMKSISLKLSGRCVLFDYFVKAEIHNNSLYISNNESENSLLYEHLSDDAFFICYDSHRALLVSKETPLLLLITKKKINKLPSGFATSIVSATFFDSDYIAFSTNDKSVHLFHKGGDMKTIDVESKIVKVQAADLNCFERSLVCLGDNNTLFLIHFKSLTVKIIDNEISDFCVIHVPFDRVLILRTDGNLQFASFEDENPLNPQVHSMIEALDSRIIIGMENVAATRKRLTLRESLLSSSLKSPEVNKIVNLPIMIPLFGEYIQNNQINSNDNIVNEYNEEQFWIENVQGMTFEIHCTQAFPANYNIIISSNCIEFNCSYDIDEIDETAIKVECYFEIESLTGFEPFLVFIIINNASYFLGGVDINISNITKANGINRIHQNYSIVFPFKIPNLQIPCEHELIDNGIVVHIKASSIKDFQKKAMFIYYSLPEDSNIKWLERRENQVKIAKQMSKYIEQILQGFVMDENPHIEKKQLIEMKIAIDDFLVAYNW